MDLSDDTQRAVFFDIHNDLPRQSAGSEASTLRALKHVKPFLPVTPQVADFGCGPGSSLIPLARALPKAQFLAADLHGPFIEEAQKRADEHCLSDRIKLHVADMMQPSVEKASLDLIWCEGAVYNVGVQSALEGWQPFLKPDGFVVFNEVLWLQDPETVDPEIRAFWAEYPGMQEAKGIEQEIANAGFKLLDAFDLTETDWWAEYYTPLEARLDMLSEKYSDTPAARLPIEYTRHEIACRRNFPETYNYRFYITRLEAPSC